MALKFKSAWIMIILACLLALAPAAVILAQTGIVIDGSFADWAGITGMVDPAGPDDETSPSDADVTEFRIAVEAGGAYVLKAWDDTRFNPAGIAAGVTIRGANGQYYRVFTSVSNNPPIIAADFPAVYSCTDSTCGATVKLCEGASCTGVLAGIGTTWADPFTGRTSPDCDGTNCATLDTGVELYLPWTLIGGAPADGQTVFFQYGSYPSGPGQGPKDITGPNGITCRNNAGVYECYISDPTAITLSSLEATSAGLPAAWIAGGLVLLVLLAGWLYERKFQYKLS